MLDAEIEASLAEEPGLPDPNDGRTGLHWHYVDIDLADRTIETAIAEGLAATPPVDLRPEIAAAEIVDETGEDDDTVTVLRRQLDHAEAVIRNAPGATSTLAALHHYERCA